MLFHGLLLFVNVSFANPPQDLPPYFVRLIQERTLFAKDEPVWIKLRLGNQKESSLKIKKWPKLIEGLTVTLDGKPLALAEGKSSKNLFKKFRNLGIGAHRDFRINLKRYFPEVVPGRAYKVTYEDKYNRFTGKNISVVNVPRPDEDSIYKIITSEGEFIIELDTLQTPNHARNFALLASMQFYKGMIFHRVIKGFVMQTGDPIGTGEGGSGYELALEESPFLKHVKYSVGMARVEGKDSASSQFYVCLRDIKDLDGGYTVFGKVTAGFDVVDAIGAVVTTGANGEPPDKPREDVHLIDVKIVPKKK